MNTITELEEKIALLIPQLPPPHYAVFDFDNTCINNDIGEAVFGYLSRNKLIKNTSLVEADINNYHEVLFKKYYYIHEQGHPPEADILVAQSISGFAPEEIKQLTITAIEAEGKILGKQNIYGLSLPKGLTVQLQIKQLMNFFATIDMPCWILSASPQPIIEAAVKYFKLPAQVIGLKNKILNGTYTSELQEPLSLAAGKPECIRTYIHPTAQPILGVGDSMNDLPMLEYAHIKLVVDGKNALADIAKQKNWAILSEPK